MPKNFSKPSVRTECEGNFTDDYYREEARKAINDAVEESKGCHPDELRFRIRRAYPFSRPRSGKPYKLWRKIMLAKEAELGFAPKRHQGKEDPAPKPEPPKPAFSSLALRRRKQPS